MKAVIFVCASVVIRQWATIGLLSKPPHNWSNLSNVKPVGGGVLEYRIDFGPGYRVYFGRDGDTLVILVGGGTKTRQSSDIKNAQETWAEYKATKR